MTNLLPGRFVLAKITKTKTNKKQKAKQKVELLILSHCVVLLSTGWAKKTWHFTFVHIFANY